jgi:hypothetical protein
VEDSQTASDAVVTAAAEIKSLETQVLPEESHVNGGGANVEADKVEENKLVEEKENEVTALSGNEVKTLHKNENSEDLEQLVEDNEPEAEVHLDVIQTNAMEVPPEVGATDHATEVGKLNVEEKKLVEENEKLRVMLEKLLEAGRNQLDVISGLNERVKGLEKKSKKS